MSDNKTGPILINSQAAKHFEDILDDGEEIHWAAKPKMLPFMARGFFFIFFGLFWLVALFPSFLQNALMTSTGMGYLLFFLQITPIWGGILNIIRLYVLYRNTSYAFTGNKIVIRTGLFRIRYDGVEYNNIIDMVVVSNLLQKIFGCGSIRFIIPDPNVNHIGVGNMDSSSIMPKIFLAFTGIKSPDNVYKKINESAYNIKGNWWNMHKMLNKVNS